MSNALCIDEERVTAPIRDENLEGGTALFPHIHGPLAITAVVEVRELAACHTRSAAAAAIALGARVRP
jgi:uncharacterized protein (DUF952 family)